MNDNPLNINPNEKADKHVDIKKRYIIIASIAVFIILLNIILFFSLKKTGQNNAANTVAVEPSSVPSTPSTPSTLAQNLVSSSTPSPSEQAKKPEEVASDFYSWYLSFNKAAVGTENFATNTTMTKIYKEEMISLYKGYKGNDPYDPVLCIRNQEPSDQVMYEKALYTGREVQVKIRSITDWNYLYTARLLNENGKWLIDDITCGPVKSK